MHSIRTHICAAAKIDLKPVSFQLATPVDRTEPYWFATQTLEITTHDGHECTFVIHLEEGCNALMVGEPLVMPPVPAREGEPA